MCVHTVDFIRRLYSPKGAKNRVFRIESLSAYSATAIYQKSVLKGALKKKVFAMNKVYFRSHGGLGNQLFQLFYALLLSKLKPVRFIHDDKYKHGFDCALPKSEFLINVDGGQKYLLQLKVPKVLKKIRLSEKEYIRLFGNYYLDGYFQDLKKYICFDRGMMCEGIDLLRNICGVNSDVKNVFWLYHLRMGDFFFEEKEEIKYAESIISGVKEGGVVISNRDDLFCSGKLKDLCDIRGINYQPTAEYTPFKLLKYISGFHVINSNGSTLAFWAGLLGKKKVFLNHGELQDLYEYLDSA